MKLNDNMREMLANEYVESHLDESLDVIARSGFVAVEDCYILNFTIGKIGNFSRNDFPDATGFECFVNSIHVEDLVSNSPLAQAVEFVRTIFNSWRESGVLTAIISADDLSVVTKIHLKRQGQSWLSDDVDDYMDAILSVDSTEDFRGEIMKIVGE